MIEYLKEYKWNEYEPVLYPVKKIDGVSIKSFNPPKGMQFCSREGDGVVFFKTESDMIAFDNRHEDLNDKVLVVHGKNLAKKIYD